jgi:hypothetical protein
MPFLKSTFFKFDTSVHKFEIDLGRLAPASGDLQFGHHSCGKFATLVVPINYKSFVASPLMICNLGTTRVENSLPPSQLYGNNTLHNSW